MPAWPALPRATALVRSQLQRSAHSIGLDTGRRSGGVAEVFGDLKAHSRPRPTAPENGEDTDGLGAPLFAFLVGIGVARLANPPQEVPMQSRRPTPSPRRSRAGCSSAKRRAA